MSLAQQIQGPIRCLKILREYYIPVLENRKTFEIRSNDRDYQVGDTLVLRELVNNRYTGRALAAVVTYMTDYAQRPGYVVLGIEKVYRPDEWFKAVIKFG